MRRRAPAPAHIRIDNQRLAEIDELVSEHEFRSRDEALPTVVVEFSPTVAKHGSTPQLDGSN